MSYPASQKNMFLTLFALVVVFLMLASSLYADPPLDNPSGTAQSGVTTGQSGNTTDQSGVTPGQTGVKGVSNYLSNLYFWFLAFVGLAALFAIVRGGITYMFAGANESLVGEAKKWITNAFFGILIAALSFIGLKIINPDLITHGFNLEDLINSNLLKLNPTPQPSTPSQPELNRPTL